MLKLFVNIFKRKCKVLVTKFDMSSIYFVRLQHVRRFNLLAKLDCCRSLSGLLLLFLSFFPCDVAISSCAFLVGFVNFSDPDGSHKPFPSCTSPRSSNWPTALHLIGPSSTTLLPPGFTLHPPKTSGSSPQLASFFLFPSPFPHSDPHASHFCVMPFTLISMYPQRSQLSTLCLFNLLVAQISMVAQLQGCDPHGRLTIKYREGSSLFVYPATPSLWIATTLDCLWWLVFYSGSEATLDCLYFWMLASETPHYGFCCVKGVWTF